MTHTFVNFTNHPSKDWDEKQIEAALSYGEIVDVPFPEVCESAGREEVHELAKEYVEKIMALNPEAVLCQGEFCLAYKVIELLTDKQVRVVAACSTRETKEWQNEDGSSQKKSVFRFAQFREY